MILHLDAYIVDLVHVWLDYYGVFNYREFISCVCNCIVLKSFISPEEVSLKSLIFVRVTRLMLFLS